MRVKYSTEFSVSLDAAVAELRREGISHKVTHETELAFHGKPCRKAKEILSRAGFTRVR